MSTLMNAEIVNAVVLAAVLEADLGPHRKITKFRILRPVLVAAGVIPLVLTRTIALAVRARHLPALTPAGRTGELQGA